MGGVLPGDHNPTRVRHSKGPITVCKAPDPIEVILDSASAVFLPMFVCVYTLITLYRLWLTESRDGSQIFL